MLHKPVAESCLRNQDAILATLRIEFADSQSVLEIGSGTGQHAAHCAPQLPHLQWQPTELPGHLSAIQAWISDAQCDNVLPPKALDVLADQWPTAATYDAVFTANTVHFVSQQHVTAMLDGVSSVLCADGIFCIYGPFNENGQYTSDGNARLDEWLKSRDPQSGIKDLDELIAQAAAVNLIYSHRVAMPANNFILVFTKN